MSETENSSSVRLQPGNEAGGLRAMVRHPAGISLLLVLMTLAVFAPVLKCDFVIFDDPLYVTDNPAVLKGLTAESVRWSFTNLEAGFWFPLTWLSHMADVQVFGERMAMGMHLTNLLLHAANTVLLFYLLMRLTGAVWRSALVAALFALHPLHVEPVAWIASRKDVLSTFFGLLTLLAYRRYAIAVSGSDRWIRGDVVRPYLLTFVFFLLGLMSKTMLVMLPVVMFLLDGWPLGRITTSNFRSVIWRLLAEKMPLLMAALGCVIITYVAEHSIGAITSVSAVPLGVRVANAVLSYGKYLSQTVWPVGLTAFYPHPKNFPIIWVIVSGVVLVLISCVSLIQWRARPWLLMGWSWYCLTLLPVSGLVQVGSHAHADRYTYVPLIGVFIIVAWLLGDLVQRDGDAKSWRRIVVMGISVIVLAMLALRSCDQLRYWKDSDALFGHGLAITSNNRTANNLMGVVEYRRGNLAKAESYWREAIRIEPADAEAYSNLGILFQQRGNLLSATEHFLKAVSLEPGNVDFLNNLGQALAGIGRREEATVCYRKALELNPRRAAVHFNLGVTLCDQGRLDDAWSHYEQAMRLDPALEFSANRNIGLKLLQSGRIQESLVHLERAVARRPDDADARNELGSAFFALGDDPAAIRLYAEALRLRPEFADAHNNLGLALFRSGNATEATNHYVQALQIDSRHALAHENLGDALLASGRAADAAEQYRMSLATDGRRTHARYHLALILVSQNNRKEAISELQEIVRQTPDSVDALNSLAWLLATATEEVVGNADESVPVAEQAAKLSHFDNPVVLDTLAAAYAAAGRFDDAVKVAQRAFEIAAMSGNLKLQSQIEQRLKFYKNHRPWRE